MEADDGHRQKQIDWMVMILVNCEYACSGGAKLSSGEKLMRMTVNEKIIIVMIKLMAIDEDACQ